MRAADLTGAAADRVRSFRPDELLAAGLVPRGGRYFPAICYPPVTMYPPARVDDLYGSDYVYAGDRPLSLYVHVPFCPGRCLYCHWAVSVGDPTAARDRYVDGLEQELQLCQQRLGLQQASITSVLIGGGTPTMLSAVQLDRLLGALRRRLNLGRCRQITCEVEPTTVLGADGMDRLVALRAHGVDRLAMGVQSLQDHVLERMGRCHSAADAVAAVQQIRRAGFDNLSIDLIYGYPGCTVEDWCATLDAALALEIDACQLYRLRIEPHGDRVGAIKRQHERSSEAFPPVDQIYLMKALGTLKASAEGLEERSRRVFARTPAHSSEYLQDHADRLHDVLGLGLSAWSSLQGRYAINTSASLADYHACLDRGRLPIDRGKQLSTDELARWAMAVPLKHNGVSKALYRERTGLDPGQVFGERIQALQQHGLLEEQPTRIELTGKGRFFADEVAIQFYRRCHIPFPRAAYAEGALNPYR